MTAFDTREHNFEAAYWHEQDLAFRIRTRRDKLLGIWAAERLGLSGPEVDRYALSVVDCDVAQHGASDAVDKVKIDLRSAGVELSDHRFDKAVKAIGEEAQRQIMGEGETLAYRRDAVEHLVG